MTENNENSALMRHQKKKEWIQKPNWNSITKQFNPRGKNFAEDMSTQKLGLKVMWTWNDATMLC